MQYLSSLPIYKQVLKKQHSIISPEVADLVKFRESQFMERYAGRCRGWRQRELAASAQDSLLPHAPRVLQDMATSIAEAVAAAYLAEVRTPRGGASRQFVTTWKTHEKGWNSGTAGTRARHDAAVIFAPRIHIWNYSCGDKSGTCHAPHSVN